MSAVTYTKLHRNLELINTDHPVENPDDTAVSFQAWSQLTKEQKDFIWSEVERGARYWFEEDLNTDEKEVQPIPHKLIVLLRKVARLETQLSEFGVRLLIRTTKKKASK